MVIRMQTKSDYMICTNIRMFNEFWSLDSKITIELLILITVFMIIASQGWC